MTVACTIDLTFSRQNYSVIVSRWLNDEQKGKYTERGGE